MPNTLALFGGGYAAPAQFRDITWLRSVNFVYWGDLDPCGLAILANLRRDIPSVRSIFMDIGTVNANASSLRSAKLPPGAIPFEFLTADERAAAEYLKREALGVEQERLLFSSCLAALETSLS